MYLAFPLDIDLKVLYNMYEYMSIKMLAHYSGLDW